MITRRRRVLFSLVLVMVPLLILALLEGLLRVTGLFAPEPVIVSVSGSDGLLMGFNAHAGRLYFDEGHTAVPTMTPDVFLRSKSTSTFRVLCLGESSTAGFPFERQVPFPRQLRQILSEAYPQRRIEVLNAGIAAISSYVIVDMLPELLETSPDLVIVYAGHDEFYGAYCNDWPLSASGGDALVRTSLFVQKTRIGQMIRSAISALRPAPPETTAAELQMQRTLGQDGITLGSSRYIRTMESFRLNLERIADACDERGIPMIFSTLVSNDRDQPPFLSPVDSRRENVQMLQRGDSLLKSGNGSAAVAAYTSVLASDPANAEAHYGAALALLLAGDTSAVRKHFVSARDHDGMRLRATSEANSIIATVARARGAGLVDLADIMQARSVGRVIGREWICDHLHPTPQGYYVMAAAYFLGIQRKGLLPPPDSSFRPRAKAYGVTALDWEIGLMKIFPMIHRWPFPDRHVTTDDYLPVGDSTTARIAREYLHGRYAWSRAHETMAEEYLRRRDYDAARNEYGAIAEYSPEDPQPHIRIADICEAEGNWPMRAISLRNALRRPGPQGALAFQLSLCELKMGQTARAIRAMGVAAEAPEFSVEERSNARLRLAELLSDIGQTSDAKRVLQVLLQEDSTYTPALQFRTMMERSGR
jgi:tetratricopeptide (TPR) repeat protein